jgi:hypothetical protein
LVLYIVVIGSRRSFTLRPFTLPPINRLMAQAFLEVIVSDSKCLSVLEDLFSNIKCATFEVVTAVTMKKAVFWDMAPCIYCVKRSAQAGSSPADFLLFSSTLKIPPSPPSVNPPPPRPQLPEDCFLPYKMCLLLLETVFSNAEYLYISRGCVR